MLKNFEQDCAIDNVRFLGAPKLTDDRGLFRKVFSTKLDTEEEIHHKIEEVFYTQSKLGVIRGMHLQVGTSANYRYVFVVSGRVHDVIIDLRPNSSSYGNKFEFLFDDRSDFVMCLPPGVAHGFQCLTSVATVGYVTTSRWQPELDTGVNPLSIDVAWPLENRLLSERDLLLPSLQNWKQHLNQLEINHEA